ncbi:MAG: ABC transporter permease, partial [Gemmatimonadota bacterium]
MLWLLAHVIGGYARTHPLRAIVQIAAIAIGVALGFAVHLINTSALAEFSAALRQVSGQADASIAGAPGAAGDFDERLLARVAADPSVEAASPMLILDLALAEPQTLRGKTLTVAGVDVFRAARIDPQWVGAPANDDRFALLGGGLYLSPAAIDAFRLAPGDAVGVQVDGRVVRLRVAGRLPAARAGAIVGAMDLGFAQWRLGQLGRLSRIDLKLAPGTDLAQLAQRLQLPAGISLQAADVATERASNLSRAYRVNLNVLALVALFTGAFLVYSLQAQAVLARRAQLGFLRVIGTTRGEVERMLILEAALLGIVGSGLGIALGVAVASAALELLGGDLGGGFFSGSRPALALDPALALGFFVLGVAAAIVGGWLPAREAARDTPALALKSGSGLDADARPARAWPGLALLAVTGVLLLAPPIGGIPVFAYLAIALLLTAAILIKPLIAPHVFAPLARLASRHARTPAAAARWLAAIRLAATPRFAAIGAAGIVASFALMVAMATMVASFRASVDDWLTRVLPADVYVRAGPVTASGTTVAFSAADLDRLRKDPQVARAEFTRSVRLALDPMRAPVTLLARTIDRNDAARSLPLTGAAIAWHAGLPPPAWVSEPIVDLYGARVGQTIDLPLAGRLRPFVVAGVWRDYARQFGAIAIEQAEYERLTGDASRTEAALWLAPGARPVDVIARLQQALDTRTAE